MKRSQFWMNSPPNFEDGLSVSRVKTANVLIRQGKVNFTRFKERPY